MVEMDIKPDMIVYLSLISAANKAGEGEAADAWLQRAKQDGILPNHNCVLEVIELKVFPLLFWESFLLLLINLCVLCSNARAHAK